MTTADTPLPDEQHEPDAPPIDRESDGTTFAPIPQEVESPAGTAAPGGEVPETSPAAEATPEGTPETAGTADPAGPAASARVQSPPAEAGAKTGRALSKKSKIAIIVLYWAVACLMLLCLALGILWYARSTGVIAGHTPTPDLTRTLQVAMQSAVPPTWMERFT